VCFLCLLDEVFNMNNFESIGTDKLSIGKRIKMGSISLDYLPFEIHNLLDETKIVVVLIRDVMDKWKSGYIQELVEYMEGRKLGHPTNPELRQFLSRLKTGYYKTFTNPDDVTKEGLEILGKLHDSYSNLSWMTQHHAEFSKWNNTPYEIPKNNKELKLYTELPNIYFLDLKDLSNPKFLEWLQERDDRWKKVLEIPHKNKTPLKLWPQMELFWKEYNENKVLKGKKLASPFFNTHSKFDLHFELCEFTQERIDYIRNNHDRYLRYE